MKKIFLFSFICILLDQIVKYIIHINLNVGENINIINNFLSITFVKNTGAAFGILPNGRIFLVISTLIFLTVIIYIIKTEKLDKFFTLIYSLLIGGIIGNLIDRMIFGYVIDFISFKLLNIYFPIFNIADICIVISCILYIYKILMEEYKWKK